MDKKRRKAVYHQHKGEDLSPRDVMRELRAEGV